MAVAASSGPGTKSPIKIFANIFISFIGAGVLGLPYAFKEAGILEGLVVMTLVAIISIKAMLLIVACKYRLIQKTLPPHLSSTHGPELKSSPEEGVTLIAANGDSEKGQINGSAFSKEEPRKPQAPGQELGYGDVGYYAMGRTGKLLVELSIVVSQIGFCCAYLIFISENLSDYIHGLKLGHWLFIMLPPLALLCLLRHLSSLAISSLFAQMSNLMAFAVVFWFDFEHLYAVEIHPKEFSAEGLPFFVCMAIYCYEGAGLILSLESSLDASIRPSFTKYFVLTLTSVTILYITFGIAGYLSFGPETNAIITLNLPKGQSLDFAIVVKSCLCLALFFTYPVMMFPVMTILEPKLVPNPDKHWQGNLLRVCMVSLTGLIVLGIPNFANLMALVGATCCTMLAFILPGLFHMRLFKGSLTRCQLAFDIFLVVLGVIGTVIGTYDAMVRLHETHHPEVVSALTAETNSSMTENFTFSTEFMTSPIGVTKSTPVATALEKVVNEILKTKQGAEGS